MASLEEIMTTKEGSIQITITGEDSTQMTIIEEDLTQMVITGKEATQERGIMVIKIITKNLINVIITTDLSMMMIIEYF